MVCNKCLTFSATDTIGDTTGDITGAVTGFIGDTTGDITGTVTDSIGNSTGASSDSVGMDRVSVRALALGWISRVNPATTTRNTAVTSHRVNFLEFD
ncbi:hypothetical protein [Nostoc sp.]|uniref:hypothetical protein n=1 Tax=Nostoc sp. TaxID=1180 RepID=UPI002FF4FA92